MGSRPAASIVIDRMAFIHQTVETMIKSMIVAAAMLLGAMAAGLSPRGSADGAKAGAGPAVVITEAGARDGLTVAAGAGLHVEAGLEAGVPIARVALAVAPAPGAEPLPAAVADGAAAMPPRPARHEGPPGPAAAG